MSVFVLDSHEIINRGAQEVPDELQQLVRNASLFRFCCFFTGFMTKWKKFIIFKDSARTTGKKERTDKYCRFFKISRRDKIRTCDLYIPNVALYQAEPHAVFSSDIIHLIYFFSYYFFIFLLF